MRRGTSDEYVDGEVTPAWVPIPVEWKMRRPRPVRLAGALIWNNADL